MRNMIFPLVLVALLSVSEGTFFNDWHEHILFRCPNRESINRLESQYSREQEDRLWNFECAMVPGLTTEEPSSSDINCEWNYSFLNDWRERMDVTCPNNGYINGVESFFNSYEGDRRWRFRCCNVTSRSLQDCQLGYANGWTENADFKISNGYVLTGFLSYYQRKTSEKFLRQYHKNTEGCDSSPQRRYQLLRCRDDGVQRYAYPWGKLEINKIS